MDKNAGLNEDDKNCAINAQTYNNCAQRYQDKFMEADLYNDTYDLFCSRVENKTANILEIGCGPGNVTRYLLAKHPGFKIHGIDLAERMIALAKVNNPQATYEVMDCRDIGQIKQQYDAIICSFCLPYISKEAAADLISDAASLLNLNGILYLSNMEDDYSQSGLKGSSTSPDKLYMYYHQADFLKDTLADNGFSVIDLLRQEYPEENAPQGKVSVTTDLFIIAKN